MAVTIILQKPNGDKIGEFPAHKTQSIAQTAKENGVLIPISCKVGICEMCKARIISWHEFIQFDKISMPMKPLPTDEKGNFKSIFTCVAGIKEKYIKDEQEYTVILEKNI